MKNKRKKQTRKVGTGKKHHENQKENEQVVVSRLRTENTRATHIHVIEKAPSPECSFCGMLLTTEYILWECSETTRERRETGTTKEVWTYGTEGLKRLIEYTKKIGLFHGI
jgi:hypothetical protein